MATKKRKNNSHVVIGHLCKMRKICAVRLLSDIRIAEESGIPTAGLTYLINYKTGQRVTNISHTIKMMFALGVAKWSVHAVIIMRDHSGKNYIKTQSFFTSPCQYSDISESTGDVIEELQAQCNQDHLINKGWIAVPFDYELNEEEMMRVIDSRNGFDFISKMERDNEEKQLQHCG
jgi:hypothetical protein